MVGSMNPERLLRVRMMHHYGFLANGLAKPRRQSWEDFGSRTAAAERMPPFLTWSVLYWYKLVGGWEPHSIYMDDIDFISV